MACQAIRSGEKITSAIVGGASLLVSPTMTIAMSEQGVLSADGSCKSFDADADGYARAEGINVLYVKRLDEAIRDGNPIRAIIRSTGTNCDGKTQGISHPSSESQESLIRRTYESAGLYDFCQTAFVECHGTGTRTGTILHFHHLQSNISLTTQNITKYFLVPCHQLKREGVYSCQYVN